MRAWPVAAMVSRMALPWEARNRLPRSWLLASSAVPATAVPVTVALRLVAAAKLTGLRG